MSRYQNTQQNRILANDAEIRRNIGEIDSYAAFASSLIVTTLNPCSAVESIELAAGVADQLSHWFDRHRAADHIAKRVDVHVDLIFRLMRKGAK